MPTLTPYDPGTDSDQLWRLKQRFETTLGATGDSEKRETYAAKLTDEYRGGYLDWVASCVAETPDCVQISQADEEPIGYIFVLPESLAYIWDAGVINELYVDDDYRGTGVADDLLDAGLAVIQDQSLPLNRVLLDVDPANARANRFYERHGFEAWGTLLAREL